MERNSRTLHKIIYCVCIIALAAGISSCGVEKEKHSYENKNGNGKNNPLTDTDIQHTAADFCRITMDDNGHKLWELHGKRATQIEESVLYDISYPVLVHYDKKEKKVLSSESGILYEKEKKVFLEGNVILKVYKLDKPESEGPEYIVKTDKVFWHQKENLIATAAPVELLQKGLRIKGLGFETRTNTQHLEVKSNISVTIEQTLGAVLGKKGHR